MRSRTSLLLVAVVAVAALVGFLVASSSQPVFAAGSVTDLDVGDYHSCAVISGGRVQCWGRNDDGQLGDGTTDTPLGPVDVCAPGATPPCLAAAGNVLTGVTDISAGYESTCAVSDEDVLCWGDNEFGQLGDYRRCGSDDCLIPTYVCDVGVIAPPHLQTCTERNKILTGAVEVSVAGGFPSAYHACALVEDDPMTAGYGVTCWGINDLGELGDGTTEGSLCGEGGEEPEFVCRLSPVDVCAAGGKWDGAENDPQCRDNGGNPSPPLTGVEEISVANHHSCARTTLATAKCWGNNAHGQLGDGTTDGRLTPVDVCVAGGAWDMGDAECQDNEGNSSPPLTGVASIQPGGYAGGGHTCALVDPSTNGYGVKCWGYNLRNAANVRSRLGDGGDPPDLQRNPVDVCEVGAQVPPTCAPGGDPGVLVDVIQVSPGGFHTCVVTTTGATGTAKCWGFDGYGSGTLGDGRPFDLNAASSTPVEVCDVGATYECPPDVLTGVSKVAAGFSHNCALLTNGHVRCWGGNADRQLGDGTAILSSTPVITVIDSDRDGCSDEREEGTDETEGGLRDPDYFWDWVDQWTGFPAAGRDGSIGVNDYNAVIARFGTTHVGFPNNMPSESELVVEAFTPPTVSTGYHASADRNGLDLSQGPNHLQPPDGAIGIGDVGAVVTQFGDVCV